MNKWGVEHASVKAHSQPWSNGVHRITVCVQVARKDLETSAPLAFGGQVPFNPSEATARPLSSPLAGIAESKGIRR